MTRVTIAEALNEVLGNWERQSPPPAPGPAMTAQRAARVLDKVEQITGNRSASLDAEWAGVPSAAAAAAVAELARRIEWSRDEALQRALQARQAGDNDQAESVAETVARLSHGLFEDEYFGVALNLLGQVARARGDTVSGLEWYRAAQDLAAAHNLPRTLSAALDNIGNCLASLGRLDEAVAAFAGAADAAVSPEVAVTIAQNWARALAAAGRIRQASAMLQTAADKDLTGMSLPPLQHGILLDNLAELALNLSDLDRAENLLRQARPGFDGLDNRLERAQHMSYWAALATERGDDEAEASAFAEAHDLMLEHWRADADAGKYATEFRATLQASATPANQDLQQRLQPGLDALNTGRPAEAAALIEPVFQAADAAGNRYVAARAAVHMGMALRESGSIDAAHEWLRGATALGRQAGDARVEAQALWNLMLLADESREVADDLTGLPTLLHVLALEELLPAIADALGLDPLSREAYLSGLGATQDRLGRLAASHGARDLARAYFAESLRLAPSEPRHPALAFARANRLASKIIALPDDTTAAELGELEHLATVWASDRRVVQSTRHARGLYHLKSDRLAEAAAQLQASCAPGEALRRTLTAQQRVAAGAAFTGPWGPLAGCYARLGDADGALQASQAAKGRHIVDVLDTRAGVQYDGAPLTVSQVRQLLEDIFGQAGTCLVDMTVSGTMLMLVVVSADRAEVRVLPLPDRWHHKAAIARTLEGAPGMVRMVEEDAVLAGLATELERLIPAGAPVIGCLDSVLQHLPLHALTVGGMPWCDRNVWSLLPAVGLLRHISGEPSPRHRRSFVGGDSRADLPAARRECQAVARAVGTVPALGADCTVPTLHDTLSQGPLDVLHLAVHGLGDWGRGRYSGLVMADARLGSVLVPFEQLSEVGLRADLVVLSGCSTAVAGPLHRSRMAGVSVAAIESGARSVVGCLWPVDDIAAEVFMKAFYNTLVRAWDDAPVDLRTCMDAGRAAVRAWLASPAAPAGHARDGTRDMAVEDVTAPGTAEPSPAVTAALAWAPFTLIGDPILFG